MSPKKRYLAAQLTLNFEPALQTTLSNFFPGEKNRPLVERLRWFLNQREERQLLMLGEEGVGKTHLLQGACWFSQDSGIPSVYLPLKELMNHEPELLQGLDYLGLVCIDDVQLVGGKTDWENALLALLTRIKSRGGQVIVAAMQSWFAISAETTLHAYLKSSFSALICHPLTSIEKQQLAEEQRTAIAV